MVYTTSLRVVTAVDDVKTMSWALSSVTYDIMKTYSKIVSFHIVYNFREFDPNVLPFRIYKHK